MNQPQVRVSNTGHRKVARVALLQCLMLGAACTPPERSPAGLADISDSAGVAIVVTSGPDRPTGWSLEPVAQVGGQGSDIELTHANEYTVDADTLGHIFVLDAWFGSVVRRLDSLGTLEAVLTRKGSGPGEIQEAVSISASPDGEISALDFSRSGLVRLSATGRPLPLLALPGVETFGAARAVGDTVTIHTASFSSPEQPEQLRYLTSRDTATLVVHKVERSGLLEFCGIGMPGLPVLLAPELRWTSRGSRVAVSHEASYRVDLFRGGRLIRSIRRIVPAVAGDLAVVRAFFPDGKVIGDKSCVVQPEELVAKRGVAPVVQAVRRLALDPQNRLWVERNTLPSDTGRVDIFDSAGTYLGTIPGLGAPLGFPARNLLVVAAADSLEVGPHLQVLRLRTETAVKTTAETTPQREP